MKLFKRSQQRWRTFLPFRADCRRCGEMMTPGDKVIYDRKGRTYEHVPSKRCPRPLRAHSVLIPRSDGSVRSVRLP